MSDVKQEWEKHNVDLDEFRDMVESAWFIPYPRICLAGKINLIYT